MFSGFCEKKEKKERRRRRSRRRGETYRHGSYAFGVVHAGDGDFIDESVPAHNDSRRFPFLFFRFDSWKYLRSK
jgi:hypothetical protein